MSLPRKVLIVMLLVLAIGVSQFENPWWCRNLLAPALVLAMLWFGLTGKRSWRRMAEEPTAKS